MWVFIKSISVPLFIISVVIVQSWNLKQTAHNLYDWCYLSYTFIKLSRIVFAILHCFGEVIYIALPVTKILRQFWIGCYFFLPYICHASRGLTKEGKNASSYMQYNVFYSLSPRFNFFDMSINTVYTSQLGGFGRFWPDWYYVLT